LARAPGRRAAASNVGGRGAERRIVTEQHAASAIDIAHQDVEAVHGEAAEQAVRRQHDIGAAHGESRALLGEGCGQGHAPLDRHTGDRGNRLGAIVTQHHGAVALVQAARSIEAVLEARHVFRHKGRVEQLFLDEHIGHSQREHSVRFRSHPDPFVGAGGRAGEPGVHLDEAWTEEFGAPAARTAEGHEGLQRRPPRLEQRCERARAWRAQSAGRAGSRIKPITASMPSS
jgi:hypothetical protein